MTIQEAIDVLNTRGAHGNLTGYAAWQTEAIDMAVRSLEAWQNLQKLVNKKVSIYCVASEPLPNKKDEFWTMSYNVKKHINDSVNWVQEGSAGRERK